MRPRLGRLRALTGEQRRVVVASVALVPLVRLSLRVRGFGRTARTLTSWSSCAPAEPDPGRARALADAVALVAGRSLMGTRCLGRSLVLWALLRRRGIDAELVIGAEPPRQGRLPAHAWVEVEGEPVNDEPGVRDRYGSFDLELPGLGEAAES